MVFHGVADADAFLAVGPVLIVFGEAEKKVAAGDDEDFAGFEALVEVFGGDGEVFEPIPVEEGAFATMNRVGKVVGKVLFGGGEGFAGFFEVVGLDGVLAEVEELAVFDEGMDDSLADVVVGEAGVGGHGGDGGSDVRVGDDDTGAGAGEADF